MSDKFWNSGRESMTVVVRPELRDITGNFLEGLILSQLIYWSHRVGDFDELLDEHKSLLETDIEIPPKAGWVYKTADELMEELSTPASITTVRNALTSLEDKGFVWRRKNLEYTLDRKYFYRVNFEKVLLEIHEHGWRIGDYLYRFRFDLTSRSLVQPQTINLSDGVTVSKSVLTHPINLSDANDKSIGTIAESTREITVKERVTNVTPKKSIVADATQPNSLSRIGVSVSTEEYIKESTDGLLNTPTVMASGPVATEDSGTETPDAKKIREVFEYWQTVNNKPRHRLTPERRAKLASRIKEYTVEELKRAVDGAKLHPFYNKRNNSAGDVYNRVETIFRTETTTANHIEYAEIHKTPPTHGNSLKRGGPARTGIRIQDRSQDLKNVKAVIVPTTYTRDRTRFTEERI